MGWLPHPKGVTRQGEAVFASFGQDRFSPLRRQESLKMNHISYTFLPGRNETVSCQELLKL